MSLQVQSNLFNKRSVVRRENVNSVNKREGIWDSQEDRAMLIGWGGHADALSVFPI